MGKVGEAVALNRCGKGKQNCIECFIENCDGRVMGIGEMDLEVIEWGAVEGGIKTGGDIFWKTNDQLLLEIGGTGVTFCGSST
jgi:hypothetical protein